MRRKTTRVWGACWNQGVGTFMSGDPFSFNSFAPPGRTTDIATLGDKTKLLEDSKRLHAQLSETYIQHYLRSLGIMEKVMIHSMDRESFMQSQSIQKLGAGAEGAVYFLRGHVVKVADTEGTQALLREIAHLIHLNPLTQDRVMGDRTREDWPALLWIYILTDGGMSIGMRTFDPENSGRRGADLRRRLAVGPLMTKKHSFAVIRSIARSLEYAHNKGVIHHDLKPENIWIPADRKKPAVIFDLGQAIWKQSRFGNRWWEHKFNQANLYNGTYMYMPYRRRLAQMGAMDIALNHEPSVKRLHALRNYTPSFHADVFAFARILMDFVQSDKVSWDTKDRKGIRRLYRNLMGLEQKKKQPVPKDSTGVVITKKLQSLFRKRFENESAKEISPSPEFVSMTTVVPAIERTLKALEQEG